MKTTIDDQSQNSCKEFEIQREVTLISVHTRSGVSSNLDTVHFISTGTYQMAIQSIFGSNAV